MKKMMLICCLLVGITAVGHAQGRPRISPADRAKQMQTFLKLTDDQTAQITAVYVAQGKSIDSLRIAGGDISAIRPVMQAANNKVKAILTAEQAAAYQKMMDERRARMQNGGGATPTQ